MDKPNRAFAIIEISPKDVNKEKWNEILAKLDIMEEDRHRIYSVELDVSGFTPTC